MSKYQFGSIVDRDFRNTLQRVADEVEVHGKTIQDLVAEGQLTEEQYARLMKAVNAPEEVGIEWDGKFEEKYNGLEAEYAEDLTTVKSQLAQTSTKVNKTKPIYFYDYIPSLETHEIGDVVLTYDNLLNWHSSYWEQGSLSGGDGTESPSPIRLRTIGYIDIDSNSQYKIVAKVSQIAVLQYDGNGTYLETTGWKSNGSTFTTHAMAKKCRVVMSHKEQELDVDIPQTTVQPILTRIY